MRVECNASMLIYSINGRKASEIVNMAIPYILVGTIYKYAILIIRDT